MSPTEPGRTPLGVEGLFSDHMVLQRDEPLRICGTSAPGDTITVSFASQVKTATCGADGCWQLTLDPLPACVEPATLLVQSEIDGSSISFSDVLVGDVWLASGQSNMWWNLRDSLQAEAEIAASVHPRLRFLPIPNRADLSPSAALDAAWQPCGPATSGSFSAVAYHFGKFLQAELGIPVGLIHASWGGTRIEAWTRRAALAANPSGKDSIEEAELGPADPAQREEWLEYSRDPAAWEKRRVPADPGNAAHDKGWAAPDFDDSSWGTMDLPAKWQSCGHPYNGVFWFRRAVEIPPAWEGRDLLLRLGACDKHDTTYFNNVPVGGLGWETPDAWRTPREYRIPASLVKPGKNVIATRVYSYMTDGGLIGPSDVMGIAPADPGGDPPLRLHGNWRFTVEHNFGAVVLPPMPYGHNNPNTPCILFENMIRPLVSTAIRGVIWYQGESNAAKASDYRDLFPLMISDWRTAFGKPDLPFLFVQLANYNETQVEPVEISPWAELREAQLLALQVPNTAMAVAIDIGEANDVHPRNKYEVGRRLALAALERVYSRQGKSSGPLPAGHRVEGDAIRMHFFHAENGLKSSDGQPLRTFAIAGPDGRFVHAEATIDGASVLVRSKHVACPVAVRYAWAQNPPSNLINTEGLPASPFRTDVT